MANHPNQLHLELARRILVYARTAGFSTGHHLTELSLQRVLGTSSRGPIRAALAHLAAEGLVESRRNKGYVLASIDDQDLSDLAS